MQMLPPCSVSKASQHPPNKGKSSGHTSSMMSRSLSSHSSCRMSRHKRSSSYTGPCKPCSLLSESCSMSVSI